MRSGRIMRTKEPHRWTLLVEPPKPVKCLACEGDSFFGRDVKMESPGLVALRMEIFSPVAQSLVCARCGHVQIFQSVPGASGSPLVRPREFQPVPEE